MKPEKQQLQALCSLIVDCPHSTPAWTETGFVVLRNQHIKNGRLDLSAPSFTDAAHFAHRNRRAKPMVGDLVITREAPMGDVCMIPEALECCLGQRQVLLRPDLALVNPRFLHYALQSSAVQRQIAWNEGTGSTVSNLRIPVLKSLSIPTPSRDAQDAIADVLGKLDDRIDILRQTNTTLEAIAQALFKSWFVDFDPVHAKAEGREPDYMDAATAALFPSEFEESEFGLIPKGWRAGTLADVSQLNATSWSKKRHPDTVAYVDLSSADRNRIGAIAELPFSEAPSRARRRLQDGDTIVGTVRPGNRAFAYIHNPAANLTGSTGFAVLSPKGTVWAPFVYLAATRNDSIDRLANLADGGAYPAVRPDVVSATPVVIPPPSITSAFSHVTAPLLQKIGESRDAEATLAELRDTLLPRLISGKLRLPEPAGTIEDAPA